MFLLVLSIGVLAAGNQYKSSYTAEYKPSIEPEKIQEMVKEMVTAKIREKIQTRVMGLENALLHVENEDARQRLTDNMEKWQNRYQYRYEYAEATMINETAMIKTRNKHMLLGLFEVQAENTYELDDEGEIMSQKRNFWAYFFRERTI